MAKATRFTQELVDEYISKGYWTGETTTELWDLNAQLYGDVEALVDSRKRLTWGEIKQQSDNLAGHLLEMGLKRGDIVHVFLPNCADSYLLRLACEKAGILCLTSLMGLREREIEHVLANFQVAGMAMPLSFRGFDYAQAVNAMRPKLPALKYVFNMGDEKAPGFISLDELAQKPAGKQHDFDKTRFKYDEVAIVGLTSGTTGMPKVSEHIIASRVTLGDSYHSMVKLTGDDVILNVISAVAGLGAAFCYSNVREAAKTVCLEIWNAKEALRLIEKERPTVILGAPAQLAMLVREYDPKKHDANSLRVVYCGTSPMTYEIAKAGEERFKVPVLNTYGSFDGGGMASNSVDDDEETRRGTVGRPFKGNEIKIVNGDGKEVSQGEIGEVLFRGACACGGYYKDIERTTEMWGELGIHGWFRTGDLAKYNQNNQIVLTGRKKDVIIRGGQNIYPSEIEGLLFMHPKVKHVAVVAMPDPVMGEKACAFVVPKGGAEFTFPEMIEFLKDQKIAKFKLPERLEIRDELPLRDSQKVAKDGLREEIIEKLKAEAEISG